jgi:uncharacterized zinc-type alcohol dehydrogenase-like protein
MSNSTVLGYAARAMGKRLEPFTYDLPKLGEHDVRVSVTHCGVCYSDIQAIDDYYGVTPYPFVPGHEIVGYVSVVGKCSIRSKGRQPCGYRLARAVMWAMRVVHAW